MNPQELLLLAATSLQNKEFTWITHAERIKHSKLGVCMYGLLEYLSQHNNIDLDVFKAACDRLSKSISLIYSDSFHPTLNHLFTTFYIISKFNDYLAKDVNEVISMFYISSED